MKLGHDILNLGNNFLNHYSSCKITIDSIETSQDCYNQIIINL